MKKQSSLIVSLALLLGVAFVSMSMHANEGNAAQAVVTVPAGPMCLPAVDLPAEGPPAQEVGKGDCSFKSDCGGAKCCKRRCAWASGSCCSFDSDCGSFKGAKCRSGKCAHAPDGKCSFNSECPSGSCSSGKCK